MEKNLIILPSSIHEVLLLPDDGDISYAEMSRLVTHINRSESLRKTACPIRYISIQGKRGRSPWHPPAPLPFADLKIPGCPGCSQVRSLSKDKAAQLKYQHCPCPGHGQLEQHHSYGPSPGSCLPFDGCHCRDTG